MNAFDKVLWSIKKQQINGHAQANIENRDSLSKAKIEIENILIKKEEEIGSKEKNNLITIDK